MIRSCVILVICLFLLMVFLNIQDQRNIPTNNLLIFYTSNLHGQLTPFSTDSIEGGKKKIGGFAFIRATIDEFVKRYRMNQSLQLLLDTGDSLFGSAEASLTLGEAPFELMVKSGYDAMAIGNMEFEFGLDVLRKFASNGKLPMLASNYRDLKAHLGSTFLPCKIIRKNETKIGIVGLGNSDLARNTRLENIEQIEISDMKAAVQKAATDLRSQGAQIVILLSHHPGFADSQNNLAELFPDIDVIIGDLIPPVITSVGSRPLICQSPRSRGAEIGVVKIPFIRGKWNLEKSYRSILKVEADRIQPNPMLLTEVQEVESRVDNLLEEVISFSGADFKRSFTTESTMGNLITDILRKAANSKIAFLNSGSIKSTFMEGPISLRDLFEVLPFENSIVSMNLYGWQIENLIEDSLSLNGSFLQGSGLQCTYCSLNPPGFRVIQIGIDDEPLEFDQIYRVAVTDFMLQNSLSWPELSKGSEIAIHSLLRENVKQYLTDIGTISPFLNVIGSSTKPSEPRFIDIQSKDETLRKQALEIELADLSRPVSHTPGIESEYAKLVADIMRRETNSDFALIQHNLISLNNGPLNKITPVRILNDFKDCIPVEIIETLGFSLKRVIEYSLVASDSTTCFSGFSIELKEEKLNQIFPWEGDFDPNKLYKVAIPANFPTQKRDSHGWYDISKYKRVIESSDIRRLFVKGMRKRKGKVELRRAVY